MSIKKEKIIVSIFLVVVVTLSFAIFYFNNKIPTNTEQTIESTQSLLNGVWVLDDDNQYVMEINDGHYIVVYSGREIESGFISSYTDTPNDTYIATTIFIDPRRNVTRNFTISSLNDGNLTLFLSDIKEKKERSFTKSDVK